jgi:hypothetical protein
VTVGPAALPPGQRRPSRRHRVTIDLTAQQAEMLLFFADDRAMGRVRARTCESLITNGLIHLDQGSRVYQITEPGQAVAAVVARRPEG